MPSTSTRGFIVRPTPSEECSLPEFSYDSVAESVQERIKDKMLEKIEEFLESDQLNELSVLATVYQKFKELHP